MASSIESSGGPGALTPAPADAGLERDIWSMAWPAMLSLVAVNIVDVIDVALIGRLGRHTVAAWGYAAQCVHLVEMLIQAVGIGCVGLAARAIGAREPARARQVLASSIVVSQGVAALGLLIVMTWPRAILRLLDAQPAVIEIAVPYFRLFAGSMVLYAAAFIIECGLRANRNTRSPMFIAILVMVTKTLVSVLLVFGLFGLPRLELVGAGIATVVAHAMGLLSYIVVSRRLGRAGLASTFSLRDLSGARQVVSEVLTVSLPAMGERLVMSLALLAYFKILSGYGTVAIAAYAIGVRLLSFSWVPGLGFATAASTLVGQALGGSDPARARKAGSRSVRQAVLVMCGLGTLFFFLRAPLAASFTSDAEVATTLVPFMAMLAIAQPFMGAHFTLGGVLRGAGDAVTPLIGAALGNWGLRVPLAWLFMRLGYDLVWVWAALIGDHAARMLITGGVFLRGRWALRTGAALRSARGH